MKSVRGSFAFVSHEKDDTKFVNFVFKNSGEKVFIQYSTSLEYGIKHIDDFEINVPIKVSEIAKKNYNFGDYINATIGNFSGIKSTNVNEPESFIFSSNVIPGSWKIFCKKGLFKKEYFIMRTE